MASPVTTGAIGWAPIGSKPKRNRKSQAGRTAHASCSLVSLHTLDDGDPRVTRIILPAVLSLFLTASQAAAADPKIDYSRDIRPILASHCWSCHGPDHRAREAGLRRDSRDAALARRQPGKPAVVPEDPAGTPLISRIEAEEAARRMPPPEAKKPLSDQQKRLLRRWIEQGADFSQHWAFVPPRRPSVPVLRDAKDDIRNPIDA